MEHLKGRTPGRGARRRASIIAGLLLAFSAVAVRPGVQAQAGRGEHWVGTWATAVVARAPLPPQGGGGRGGQPPAPPPNFKNQTIRQIVRVSLGGDRVRVVFSNAFGTDPLPIGGAQVALRAKDSMLQPKSDRRLTFGGRPTTTIPAGAVIVSDPVALTVPPLADLAVDLHLPGDTAAGTSPLTIHGGALQSNYVSSAGNHVGAATFPVESTVRNWFFLSRVEVSAPENVGAVVVLGDSITDGTASTPDTNNRWPDHLARRLNAPGGPGRMGVLNVGIGGNRVLTDGPGVSAQARLDRDVLVQPGATHVIFMEGINDMGRDATADDLIAAHKQIIERVHAKGLKILGGTLTPMEDTTFNNYYTPAHEATRQALNEWIRTSKAYDAVIDFDAALRDPGRPTKLQAKYAAMDNLHPNDAGYELMARTVDLALLGVGQRATAGAN
jgi:lysophospholipase L1-like esterase